MSIGEQLRGWALRVKRDGVTLWFASKSAKTPWYAKALGVFVVAYALSPIDLVPDFIPILGYVDDVLLLPVLIWLAVKLLPIEVLKECRRQADEWLSTAAGKPTSTAGVYLVVAVWLVCAGSAYLLLRSRF